MSTVIDILPDGTARCLWTDNLPLTQIGHLEIKRASTVEFNPTAQTWEVRLASNPDAVAFSHPSRATCLAWEIETINSQLLNC